MAFSKNYQLNVRLVFVFFVSLILTIIPIPNMIVGIRPPWSLLLILYIQFFLPKYFNLSTTLLVGLLLDVLLSTCLGEHMFALVLTTWIASARVRRFHLFSLPQQMALITFLCLFYQSIIYFIDSYQGYNHSFLMVIGATMMSLVMWPWVRFLLTQWLNPVERKNLKYI
jgi:rod shape-determining protein MreD